LIRPGIALRRAGINGEPSAAYLSRSRTMKVVVMHMIDWNTHRQQVVTGVATLPS
jgi:hypothetical protein